MIISNPCVTRISLLSAESAKRQASMLKIAIKSLILLAFSVVSALLCELVSYGTIFEEWSQDGLLFGIDYIVLFLVSAFFGAFAFLLGVWLPRTDVVTAPVFAFFTGLTTGFFSMIFQELYSLIVFSAFFSAFSTVFVSVILHAYEKFRSLSKALRVIYCALSGLTVGQVIFFVLTLVFTDELAFFSGKYWLQLLLSALFVTSSALALSDTLDGLFDCVFGVVPKKLEWLGAMGILFSLVLMHFEFLRVFAFAQSKTD